MTLAAERAKAMLDSAAVTRAFKVIAICSLLLALFTGVKQYRLATCLAEYSDATNANSRARATATAQDRKAVDDVILAIADARSKPPAEAKAAVDKAFADYKAARAFADGARSVSPIPDPPSAHC